MRGSPAIEERKGIHSERVFSNSAFFDLKRSRS
jgi:hypothetical protein